VKLILLLHLSAVPVLSLPATDDDTVAENKILSCDEVFTSSGLNYSSFWKGAAHGIHSLSLEEIRHFFKADAPEDNKIPTVNIDFRSEDVIHFSAPLWGYEERFESWALKIMDWFMMNNKPYLYETGTNALEKLTHQYHMQEIYQRAAVIYKDLLDNPPTDPELCTCANDVTANGILKEVVNIARQLKYRARSGRAKPGPGGGCSFRSYESYWCSSNKYVIEKRDTRVEELRRLREEYLNNSNEQTANDLLSADPWIPGTLARPDQWVSYSAMLTYSLPSQQGIRDFATFIFCKLNQPSDHPPDLF